MSQFNGSHKLQSATDNQIKYREALNRQQQKQETQMTQDQIQQAGLVVANQMHEAQMRAERDRQELLRDRRVLAAIKPKSNLINLQDLSKALADRNGADHDKDHQIQIHRYLKPLAEEIVGRLIENKVNQLMSSGQENNRRDAECVAMQWLEKVKCEYKDPFTFEDYGKHLFPAVEVMACISLYDVREFERRHPQKLVQIPECIRTAEAPKYEEEKSLQQMQLEYAYEIYQENIKNKVKGAIDKACREAAKKYAHHPEKDFLAVTTLKSYVPKYRDWKAGKIEKPTWSWFK